jgi:hypothetical protein
MNFPTSDTINDLRNVGLDFVTVVETDDYS